MRRKTKTTRNDANAWSPKNVYRYLRICFRRQDGELLSLSGKSALVEKAGQKKAISAFTLAQQQFAHENVTREMSRRTLSLLRQPRKKRPTLEQLRDAYKKKKKKQVAYVKGLRRSIFDDSPLGLRGILYKIRLAEFPWIILKSEGKRLRPHEREQRLKQVYDSLPHVHLDGFGADLKRSPYSLAIEEVAKQYQVTAESLKRMIRPSYQRRAGMPPSVAQLYKNK